MHGLQSHALEVGRILWLLETELRIKIDTAANLRTTSCTSMSQKTMNNKSLADAQQLRNMASCVAKSRDSTNLLLQTNHGSGHHAEHLGRRPIDARDAHRRGSFGVGRKTGPVARNLQPPIKAHIVKFKKEHPCEMPVKIKPKAHDVHQRFMIEGHAC